MLRSGKRLVGMALVCVVWLVGCAAPGGQLPDTGAGTPVSTQAPAVTAAPVGTQAPDAAPAELPAAVLAAQQWLGAQINAAAGEIRVEQMEQVTWSDSCLGLGGPAESCLQALTPGWRVQFVFGGQTYVVHTNETGSAVRLATGAQN
ncbi:MAG: hypothetical protein ACKOC5_11230 [Chloroflexota bacterium]